jgi:hypothetical protein
VTSLAVTLDVAVAASAALVAGAWLVQRGLRAWRGKASGCGCGPGKVPGCSAADGIARDFRAAAARGARRVGASRVDPEPPAVGPR